MYIGFVGWRGMVGSVLNQRMREEDDFSFLESSGVKPIFFSTQEGISGPFGEIVSDSYDLDTLSSCRVIVTSQGSDWTKSIHPLLIEKGWDGIWLDASSAMRMDDDSFIVLDLINGPAMKSALEQGIRKFIGANCTVSLMLMALHGLFEKSLVEWVHSSTYQAASGAGAKHMQELFEQMRFIGERTGPAESALELERNIRQAMGAEDFPRRNFAVSLAASLIPWIDSGMDNGQTREEWKGGFEANKILGITGEPIPVAGICVRVGSFRCHSQGLLIKLRKKVSLERIIQLLEAGNEWVEVVPNIQEETFNRLTPASISGSLRIAVGRLHHSPIGEEMIEAFTVGDQLLWGAAEPIRRALRIIVSEEK